MTRVRLYTRPGCHLCDRARDALVGLQGELGSLEIEEVDIDSDDALFKALLERIPVIEVDGRIVTELEWRPEALRPHLLRETA